MNELDFYTVIILLWCAFSIIVLDIIKISLCSLCQRDNSLPSYFLPSVTSYKYMLPGHIIKLLGPSYLLTFYPPLLPICLLYSSSYPPLLHILLIFLFFTLRFVQHPSSSYHQTSSGFSVT